MRVSPDWAAFMRNFNRNFRPHMPEQGDLFDEIDAAERTSSASRLTAGASGFLNLSQSGDRPDL